MAEPALAVHGGAGGRLPSDEGPYHEALAAATSTGGTRGQLPGRVGDSPVFGAGTYADSRCAVSATGDGEVVIRAVAAYEVARLVADGVSLGDAADRVLRDRVATLGGKGGLIALGAEGEPAMPFSTEVMHRGWHVGDAAPATAIGP